jgi:hypothetical protein
VNAGDAADAATYIGVYNISLIEEKEKLKREAMAMADQLSKID